MGTSPSSPMAGPLVSHPWSQGAGHCLLMGSAGRWWLAGSGAALVPPPSGPGTTWLRSAWGHPPQCHGCPWVQHPPHPNTTPGSACAALPPISTARPSRRGRTSSSAHQWVCQGQHGWPRVGTSHLHPLCLLDGKERTVLWGPVPTRQAQEGSVPLLGREQTQELPLPLTWYRGVEAEGSSPANSDSESSSFSMQ